MVWAVCGIMSERRTQTNGTQTEHTCKAILRSSCGRKINGTPGTFISVTHPISYGRKNPSAPELECVILFRHSHYIRYDAEKCDSQCKNTITHTILAWAPGRNKVTHTGVFYSESVSVALQLNLG